MFDEDGYVSRVFANRSNLIGRLLGIVAIGPFVTIHFQEKSTVTAWTIAAWEIIWRNSLAIALRPIVQAV